VRNVFLFIRRYFNFLFFILLQVIALSFLFRYNKFHEAAFLGLATEVTGRFNEKYNKVEYYFQLKKTNDSLAKDNVRMHQLLKENYEAPETGRKLFIDTANLDSLEKIRKYYFRDAKVVGSTTSLQTNYITIHRGSAQQIKPNMGVVSSQGIVGQVVNVSQNYAIVMSLFHRLFKVVVKLKHNNDRGTIEWDGLSPLYVTLKNIPKSVVVNKGDTVLTSQTSSLFPPNIMVGTVSEIIDDKSSNFYTLKIRPSTNFFNLEYVYVTENLQYDEQKNLEDSTRKKIQ
jgi:rod shape-determining protein MreC